MVLCNAAYIYHHTYGYVSFSSYGSAIKMKEGQRFSSSTGEGCSTFTFERYRPTERVFTLAWLLTSRIDGLIIYWRVRGVLEGLHRAKMWSSSAPILLKRGGIATIRRRRTWICPIRRNIRGGAISIAFLMSGSWHCRSSWCPRKWSFIWAKRQERSWVADRIQNAARARSRGLVFIAMLVITGILAHNS